MAQTVKTHSMIGIASCAIGTAMFFIFLIANIDFYFQFKQGKGAHSETVALFQIVVEMILPIPVHAICLILGCAALFFPNRKKLFPIIGIILNLIFGVCGLFPWLWLVIGGMGRV